MAKKTQLILRKEYFDWTVYPHRCAICWIPGSCLGFRANSSLEMAHIISRARGGSAGNVVGNVLFLCSSCHGSQHQSGYIWDGIKWPEILSRHLFRAKMELGELSVQELAMISGYTPRYILDLTQGSWPDEITAERLRWGH